MEENQSGLVAPNSGGFNGDIIDPIGYLFNVTCFNEAELHTKITMKTPGRTYTILRTFKFNFRYLFSLSSTRKEIDENKKRLIVTWFDMDVPYGNDGDVDKDYIKAGLSLFSTYRTELQKARLISYKK